MVENQGMKISAVKTSIGGVLGIPSDSQWGDLGEPLSPGSRVFHDPQFNCHIICIMGFKTGIDTDVFKSRLQQTLLKHPRFSSKMVERGGMKRWVRTRVILEDHMTISRVGDDIQSPDRYVEDYVRDLTRTSLDTSRPLWEFHIINSRTSEAEAVVVMKLHHSLGDGVSLIRLLLACTRKTSDPHALPTLPVQKKRSRAPTTLAHAAWSVCRLLWNTFIDVLMFIATMTFLNDTSTPLRYIHRDAGASSPKRIVHRTFSMDDIRTVKRAMNVTVNDVVVGMTQAGISRYLDRRGCGLSGEARFRSVVLVNLRQSTDVRDMHEMLSEGEEFRWGNMIGYVLLPMSVVAKDDASDYVREAKAAVDRRKMSLESRLTYSTVKFLLSILEERSVVRMTRNVLRNTSMSFSNVAGPDEEVDFCGHTLAYLAPSVYGHPHALTVHFQSYADKMTVVVTADETVIPDPHELCTDFVTSLQLIKASL